MEKSAQNPTIQLVELRNRLGDTINEITYTGRRLTITRNGKPAAALICIEDLELLEALELKRDSQKMTGTALGSKLSKPSMV